MAFPFNINAFNLPLLSQSKSTYIFPFYNYYSLSYMFVYKPNPVLHTTPETFAINNITAFNQSTFYAAVHSIRSYMHGI